MAFDTPQPPLSEYLKWTTSGVLQLPDFQRTWRWDDDRIRSLLVTVLRGHPMGAVMLLETGSNLIRFKPKPIEGVELATSVEPRYLLLDGQQRLTSLTQALTGDGVVQTKDANDKLVNRRYYVDMKMAVESDESIDDAVISVPGDGIERVNFGREIKRDLSTTEKELEQGMFPLRLLLAGFEGHDWLMRIADRELAKRFSDTIYGPATTYQIPAIELKKDTSKSAVATVFEKVNTGGVPLNVFELLTATFAGDAEYFAKHGSDFRLNDDWHDIQRTLANYPVLKDISSTFFLQGITLLVSRERQKLSKSDRPPAVSAKREDILRLELNEYVAWRHELVKALEWVATFLADQHIFAANYLPYASQLVPLSVIRVVLGREADTHGTKDRIKQWFWSGILGELYGSTTETRFARDVEQVPDWAAGKTTSTPTTVNEANFVENRLYTLQTRNSAAYKGIYALIIGRGAKDWIRDVSFDKVQYSALATDIHHIFPDKWCRDQNLDRARWNSIVNKTPLAADTNRAIGGVAPSIYLNRVETKAHLDSAKVDALISTHGVNTDALRSDDFATHFESRKEFLLELISTAMGKRVQRAEGEIDAAAIASEYELEDDEDADEVTDENL